MSQSVPAKEHHDMQIGTDDPSKPQMVTTTIQHRGGEMDSGVD